jgi:ABC-type sugar transport system substrate-binding protein
VDVIAFSPIVETGWDNVLQEAKDAGIPVLTTDRMIRTEDESLYAGFIGSDFHQEGVRAGEFLIEKAEREGRDMVVGSKFDRATAQTLVGEGRSVRFGDHA